MALDDLLESLVTSSNMKRVSTAPRAKEKGLHFCRPLKNMLAGEGIAPLRRDFQSPAHFTRTSNTHSSSTSRSRP